MCLRCLSLIIVIKKKNHFWSLIREVSQIVANSPACCFAFSRIRVATHNQMHFPRLEPLTRPLLLVNFAKFSGIARIAREAWEQLFLGVRKTFRRNCFIWRNCNHVNHLLLRIGGTRCISHAVTLLSLYSGTSWGPRFSWCYHYNITSPIVPSDIRPDTEDW